MSRRDLCAGALAGLVIAACSDHDASIVQTGSLTGTGGDDDTNPVDAPDQQGSDAATPPVDGAASNACVGAATDTGKTPAAIVAGTPFYFSGSKLFVVRDAGGLYAVTAKCTHEGATCVVQGSDFYCPRHGAKFTFDGAIVSGPVIFPLVHYAMCVLPNGNVGVQTATQVPASTRMVA